ncbi:MAG: CorA family divalent cation transporter [Glutamicibacter arilaitensis]
MSRVQRRAADARPFFGTQNSSHTSMTVRYIDDGTVATAPEGTSAADALAFGQSGDQRIALSLYPTPDEADIRELTEAWQLHPVLVEDLVHARQRPKLERYGEVMLLVVRSALYLDETEEVELSEFHILMRKGALPGPSMDRRY